MKISRHNLSTQKPGVDISIALVADLHSKKYGKVISKLKDISPDIILCAGDILERLDGYRDKENKIGFEFLTEAKKIAPTYYSFGNHELYGGSKELRRLPHTNRYITPENMKKIRKSGAVLLDDEYVEHNGVLIAGLSSGLKNKNSNIPNLEFAKCFADKDGYKILMCHHPEYYKNHLLGLDFDLILSGHAHGGQWRILGLGIYAPNQGLFPKYTSGIYDGRLIVSRGVSNSVFPIPRIFNRCEVVHIRIKSEE